MPTPNLRVYNTLTRRKEVLAPRRPGHLDLYVCGMTVYDLCHVGHARAFLAFDVIVRYLRARGWTVRYVRNVTDIDDKILARAAQNGEDYRTLTGRMIAAMHDDFASLGILPPDEEPRATEHVDEMLALIGTLVAKGHAYAAGNGDVYFRVASFAGYGKLSGKRPDELLVGARVEVGEQKEDPRDFALWKAAKPGEASWESPWGRGRPGWHIECSAMSMQCLGKTFDIHGGGPDLVFPHHENEIAQSEAATGQTFANCWMHAGPLRVNDEKMSKSLGNFFTIRDVVAQYPPEVVRYLLISSHYRSPMNWSEAMVAEARESLSRLYQGLRPFAGLTAPQWGPEPASVWQQRFCAAMDDDFNTREALAGLHELVRNLNTAVRDGCAEAPRLAAELKSLGATLGILQQDPTKFLQSGGSEATTIDDAAVEVLIAERAAAKKAHDFTRADAIRNELAGQGVVLEDTREGTIWRRG